jgi:hypothetical protein
VREAFQPYLWVDALCLDQDIAATDSQTLSQFDAMSEICQSAYLTIVGAAGQDSQAGLPGIRPDSRRVSRVTELVDGTYSGSSYQVISNTKWNTRAWTYQEMLLSKRILVFTYEEVPYECDSEGALLSKPRGPVHACTRQYGCHITSESQR